jgi:glucose/arabinose dehydrogenase
MKSLENRRTSRLPLSLLLALSLSGCHDEIIKFDAEPDSGTEPPKDSGSDSSGGAGGAPATNEPLELDFEPVTLGGDADFGTDFVFLPDESEFLLLEKSGEIHHYALDGNRARHLGNFTVPGVYDSLDCGAISLVLDPSFATSHLFYVGTCTSIQSSGIYRYTFDAEDYGAIPESEARVIDVSWASADRPWHNVGSMAFDSQGYLFALFGDKVSTTEAQNFTNNLGSLIRIVPNREADGSGYTPAPGNPYQSNATYSPDIYAKGLRSPFRGTLDHKGRFWFGDVGASSYEELNAVTAPGQNFGWPAAEGPCETGCKDFREPISFYGRDFDSQYFIDDPEASPTGARVIWAGPEYLPSKNDRYDGRLSHRVLFGDFCVGFMRAATLDADGELASDVPIGHLRTPASLRQGPDGYLYALTFGRCQTDIESAEDTETKLFRAVARQ